MAVINVIIGPQGSGKTLLFNKLGLKNQKSAEGDESLTRNIFKCQVNCGDYTQYIIDTPGTGSRVDVYQHALLLKTALTHEKLNTIFVMVKYDSRTDTMGQCYEKTIEPLVGKGYEKHVVIIICKFDQCPASQREQRKQQIREYFKEQCENPNLDKMIFYDYNIDAREVANTFYHVSHNMPSVQLEYSETDFVVNFPVLELDLKMRNYIKKSEKQIKEIVARWNKFIRQDLSSSTEDYEQILLSVLAPIRSELESIDTKCQEFYADDMVEFEHYAKQIELNKRIRQEIYQFEDLIYTIVKKTQPPEAKCIRRCPHCSIIWLKVEGCNGSTRCGERPSSSHDVIQKPWAQYTFSVVNNVIQWTKNYQNRKEIQEVKVTAKGKGCNNEIIWNEMPFLQSYELKILYESVQVLRNLSGKPRTFMQKLKNQSSIPIFMRYEIDDVQISSIINQVNLVVDCVLQRVVCSQRGCFIDLNGGDNNNNNNNN